MRTKKWETNCLKKLVENFKNMNEGSEKNHYSRTEECIYRNGHDNKRLEKWMAFYDSVYKNKKYFD